MRKLLLVSVPLILASCQFMGGERVKGNGHIITQNRNVGSFDELEVGGAFKVHLVPSGSNSVRIETDENLMEYVDVSKSGGKLEIRSKNDVNLDPSKDLIVYVSAPVWKLVSVSGACDLIGDGEIKGNEALDLEMSGAGDIRMAVDVPKLSTHISGSSGAELSGKVEKFSADMSGSGELHCFNLITQSTSLDLSGACDVEITAEKELEIEASGASSVKYRGSPNVKQNSSGASSVKKVD